MVRGTVALPNGGLDSTTYSSCMSTHEGLFYYKTQELHLAERSE